MILSMTGYGRAKGSYKGRNYSIDIKSLNGKTSEVRLKSPSFLRGREIDLRSLIIKSAVRGKVDTVITAASTESDTNYKLNLNLIETYYKQLSGLTNRIGVEGQDFLQTIIRIPSVIESNDEDIAEEEWVFLQELCKEALEELNNFRSAEGKSLEKDLQNRVNTIDQLLESVPGLETQRNDQLKGKLNRLIDDQLQNEKADANRLEQEIIYYLEKLDIHEEKIRLKQHCDYFITVMGEKNKGLGKKLNFISQEMGREINTLGSKAQFGPLQKVVVQMKVELDQIKEQLANVL